jgi:CheY-like chemotaxis protein
MKLLEGRTEVEQTNKKTVLIVDDELGIRRLVRKILNNDYAVLEAQNGEEAVNMAHTEKPDIVLMDIMMPKVDGLTACSAIKKDQATKGIPVVMLTAVSYELNKKLAENVAAANAYITKPFSSQELLSIIGQLLSFEGQISGQSVGKAPSNTGEPQKAS